jgi:hypothetical protein
MWPEKIKAYGAGSGGNYEFTLEKPKIPLFSRDWLAEWNRNRATSAYSLPRPGRISVNFFDFA